MRNAKKPTVQNFDDFWHKMAGAISESNNDISADLLLELLECGFGDYARKTIARQLAVMWGNTHAADGLNAYYDQGDMFIITVIYPYFIRVVEPGSESHLIEVLNVYGNESMAMQFYESGNSTLEQAALDWLHERGLTIVTIPFTIPAN
jgi:hypothetical protein